VLVSLLIALAALAVGLVALVVAVRTRVMVGALRCSACGVNWPHDQTEYGACPKCGAKTWSSTSSDPLPKDQARSLKLTALFDRYMARWDEDRVKAQAAELQALPTDER
jgi:predicted RNA-binding Zn-ribbon protein involved in translation (DUF1610 family)